MTRSTNIVWHHATVTRARREALNGHRSVLLWFTGVSSPYEEPDDPELVVDTGSLPLDACVAQVIALLQERGVIS